MAKTVDPNYFCDFNSYVDCSYSNEERNEHRVCEGLHSTFCYSCGWNPNVAENRSNKINEKFKKLKENTDGTSVSEG